MPQQRQLAAIMFTDIVSYTAMMQKNELHALALLKRNKSVLGKIVSDYEGDVVEYYGDGSLCIFFSVTEALSCALALQKELQKEPAVPLRIGLHIGEVLFEEGKVMGDGINVSSRIQALGGPGNVLFTREIFNKIKNHEEFQTISLGFFHLKNVDEPMEVFALANEGLSVPKAETMEGRVMPVGPVVKPLLRSRTMMVAGALLLAALAFLLVYILVMSKRRNDYIEKSIAILPFRNMSNDTLQDYFSDGITEDIITQISKIAGLRVISGTSVMQYKNVARNITQIGEELEVATILEGSVRKEGNQVRITAQLIDAKTDRHIWANNYDRSISEVFAIQSEVAKEIARELNVKLTTDEGRMLQKKATVNVSAYEDYLQARQSPRDQAEKLLLRAIQKDSSFALAWSSLALLYARRYDSDSINRPYYMRKSLKAALVAVNLGPELSETHMVFGDILKVITLSPLSSIKEIKKSIKLNPNNAEAYVYFAFALMELGRFRESEENLHKAKKLDPRSRIMRIAWARLAYYAGDAEKFLQVSKDLIATDGDWRLLRTMASYYFLKNNYDSMLVYANQANMPAMKAIALIRTGKEKLAVAIVDSLKTTSEFHNAFNLGIIYAWLGDKEKGMSYLNAAYRQYDYSLISIKVDKLFEPLVNEPSFKNLLLRITEE